MFPTIDDLRKAITAFQVDGECVSIQRRNSLLLLCDLGCVVVGGIDFGTVFAAFRSGHRDNLFPLIS